MVCFQQKERVERANVQGGAIHRRDRRNNTAGTLADDLGDGGSLRTGEMDRGKGESWDIVTYFAIVRFLMTLIFSPC